MDNKTDWIQKFKDIGMLWQHGGDCSMPHALLTSGKHSDSYNNGAKLVENPKVLEEVVAAMIENTKEYLNGEVPDVIMGPAMGAITIGHEWARQLGTKFAFTEPVHTESGKMQELKRFDIPTGSKVLIVEDMVTTGGSIQKTIDALKNIDVEIYPFVPIILDRSNGEVSKLKDGRRVIPLVRAVMNVWEPEDCELCKCGSEALRPKANWSKLSMEVN